MNYKPDIPGSSSAAISSSGTGGDIQNILDAARKRLLFGYVVDLVVVLIILAALSLFFASIISTATYYLSMNKKDSGFFSSLEQAAFILLVIILVFVYISLYLLPFVLTLPITAPLIGLWVKPARFLLLRPFGRGKLNRPLKRIVRHDLSPFGHIYTLSDADIFTPWYIRIPLLLGQMALFSFRIKRVRKPEEVANLEKAIDRTWLRNINWCLSYRRIFAVASNDNCWQAVVRMFAEHSSLIILDASDLKPNVLWEVMLCKEIGVSHRVIFLVSEDKKEEAMLILHTSIPDLQEDKQVFVYSKNGILNSFHFQTQLASILAEENRASKKERVDWSDKMVVILFSLQIVPLVVFIIPNLRPFEIEAFSNSAASLNLILIGLITLLLLILRARRHSTLYFHVVVQILVLSLAYSVYLQMASG